MLKYGMFTKSAKLIIILAAIATSLSLFTYYFSGSISTRLSEIVNTGTTSDLQGSSMDIATPIIIGIWVLAVWVGITVATWNKTLQKMVSLRIAELEKMNQDSAISNIQLRAKLSKLASDVEELEKTNSSLSAGMEQLQTNDRLQREFVNIAAHELRTPVQPILGMADLLEGQFEEGKERIEITKAEVELIVRNARRLERLTSDMLEVARIDSGTLKINKERFSLDELIATSIIDAKSQFKANYNNVKILFEPSGISVVADKDKMAEVIQNLLSNAIKFTNSGAIAIDSQVTNDNNVDNSIEVVVRVKDSGTGIDPEILPYVFTKFVTRSDRGTGLGLYISRSIIEAHGGKIWGKNNEDGKGATFSFSLPLDEKIQQEKENKLENNDGLQAQ